MDRSITYAAEGLRSYDIAANLRRMLISTSQLTQDIFGSTTTVVGGFAITPTGPLSLSINLAAGRIYQLADVDATTFGTIPADLTVVEQQGWAAAQTLTLTTAGLAAGQSQYALVQVIFSQTDGIPADDPTNGVLNFFNAANPQIPLVGPGGNSQPLNTVRKSLAVVSVVYGTAATTGSEAPPNPSAGNVPLYLVDLAYGQTQITSGQILTAGPSVGNNVPSNYPQAPFLAGLLHSHHSGGLGQAPKIKLGSEVQGVLPLANLPASSANSGGGVSAAYAYGGNPNSHVAGSAGTAGVSPPDTCYDLNTGNIWVCTTTGSASTAVWSQPGAASATAQNAWGGTAGGSANVLTATTAPTFGSLVAGQMVTLIAGITNTGAATFAANALGAVAIRKRTSSGLAALTGGELVATDQYTLQYDGTFWQILNLTQGTCAALNIGNALFNDGAGNLAVALGTTGSTAAAGNDSRITGAITAAQLQAQAGNGVTDTGTANAYAATLSPALGAHTAFLPIRIKIANNNTGASTFTPNGLSTKNLLRPDGSALNYKDLVAGGIYTFIYNGTAYEVMELGANIALALVVKFSPVSWFNTGLPILIAGAVPGLYMCSYDYGLIGHTGVRFADIVLFVTGQTPVVVNSVNYTVGGSPGTRTYSCDGSGNLNCAISGAVAAPFPSVSLLGGYS